MTASIARLTDEFMSDFGARLQKEINRVGLNQRQVSLKSGVDYPALNKIIKKNQTVTLETLVKLLAIPELKPFLVDEIKDRSPELFSPETMAIVERSKQILAERGPEGVKELARESGRFPQVD